MARDKVQLGSIDSEDLARLVSEWIDIRPQSGLSDDLDTRLDVLNRLVDLLRYHGTGRSQGLTLKDLLAAGIAVEHGGGRSSITLTGLVSDGVSPKETSFSRPTALQHRLLIFLLVHCDYGAEIFDTIDRFVRWNRPRLHLLDFERTKSGPARVTTNTRFAAGDLRAHGILRYSNAEAFKTWELSLVGVLLALELFARERAGRWREPETEVGGRGLDARLYNALDDLLRPERFEPAVKRLFDIAKIDPTELKRIHGEILNLYREYVAVLGEGRHGKAAQAEATKEAAVIANRLESLPNIQGVLVHLRDFLQSHERSDILEAMFPADDVQ